MECVGRRWLPARDWATVAFKPGPGMHSRVGRGRKQGGESTEDKDNGKASLPGPLHTSKKT